MLRALKEMQAPHPVPLLRERDGVKASFHYFILLF